MAGGGASGEHETAGGILEAPLVDELERKQGFPDADGMDVGGSGRLAAAGAGVDGDALEQPAAEATALEHFHQPARKRGEEKQRQQQAIKEEDGPEGHGRCWGDFLTGGVNQDGTAAVVTAGDEVEFFGFRRLLMG